jgi:hypothetical protein
MYKPKIGDPVIFGRKNGERTRGTVVKVNQKTAGVRQDEHRGTQKDHKIGCIWKVPFSLLTFDEERKDVPEADRLMPESSARKRLFGARPVRPAPATPTDVEDAKRRHQGRDPWEVVVELEARYDQLVGSF